MIKVIEKIKVMKVIKMGIKMKCISVLMRLVSIRGWVIKLDLTTPVKF
jgi:hypothetical protein